MKRSLTARRRRPRRAHARRRRLRRLRRGAGRRRRGRRRDEITRAELDDLLARAKKSYTAQKREFPKAGTAEYQSLQTQAVAFLVQRDEYAREAEKLGVTVTDAQIDKKIDEVKKQYFANDQKKFEQGLAEQGYTVATLRDDIRAQLMTEGIYDEVTKDVKVTDDATPEVLRQEQAELHRRRVARRAPHPRQDEGGGRQAARAARGRRRLRRAREEVARSTRARRIRAASSPSPAGRRWRRSTRPRSR